MWAKPFGELAGLLARCASRKWVSCRSVFPLSSGLNRGSESTRAAYGPVTRWRTFAAYATKGRKTRKPGGDPNAHRKRAGCVLAQNIPGTLWRVGGVRVEETQGQRGGDSSRLRKRCLPGGR